MVRDHEAKRRAIIATAANRAAGSAWRGTGEALAGLVDGLIVGAAGCGATTRVDAEERGAGSTLGTVCPRVGGRMGVPSRPINR